MKNGLFWFNHDLRVKGNLALRYKRTSARLALWSQLLRVATAGASNWGNWQYIAGVCVDPSGGRWFDIEKQTALYDPDRSFINAWDGNLTSTNSFLDSVDAAGWPVQIN